MTKRRGMATMLLALAALGVQSNNAQATRDQSPSGTRAGGYEADSPA